MHITNFITSEKLEDVQVSVSGRLPPNLLYPGLRLPDHSHFRPQPLQDVEFTTHGSTEQCESHVVLGNALRQLFKHLQGAHMCGEHKKSPPDTQLKPVLPRPGQS